MVSGGVVWGRGDVQVWGSNLFGRMQPTQLHPRVDNDTLRK